MLTHYSMTILQISLLLQNLSTLDAFSNANHHHHPLSKSSSSSALGVSSSSSSSSTSTNHLDDLLDAIDTLFPPQGLQERMALSRKDGYWPFIQSGEEPPQEFVYGEFDVTFFCSVLDRAREIIIAESQDHSIDDAVFCDLGSGTGRLVLAAAAWRKWKLCRGIELLEGIHDQAVEKLEACRRGGIGSGANTEPQAYSTPSISTPAPVPAPTTLNDNVINDPYQQQYNQYAAAVAAAAAAATSPAAPTDSGLWLPSNAEDDDSNEEAIASTSTDDGDDGDDESFALSSSDGQNSVPLLSPIQLSCGSFEDPYEFFGDSDVIFVFSTAMPYHILVNLARAVGRQCKVGTLVITTEYQLPLGGDVEAIPEDPTLPYGPYELELVESFTGPNLSVGGESTVFIHRVTKSYGTGKPFVKPKVSGV